MKKQILVTVAAVGLACAGCRSTERTVGFRGTQLEDLPTAAQASVKQEIGDSRIIDIDKERRSGRLVYEVTYQSSQGTHDKVHVTEDGRLLNSKQASVMGWFLREPSGERSAASRTAQNSTTGTASSSQFGAANSEAQRHGTYASSDTAAARDSASSRDNYRTGRSTASDKSKSSSQLSNDRSQAGYAASAAATTGETASGPKLGTKYEDLPPAVKDTVQEQYSSADIADIDKRHQSGKTVYEISFKQAGRNPKIFVAEDGKLMDRSEFRESAGASREHLEAPRNGRGAAEALLSKKETTPYFQAGELKAHASGEEQNTDAAASSSAEAAGAEKRLKGDESSITHLKTSDLPEAVQKTIEDRAGSAKVMSIDKKMKNGKTVYEVKFQDSEKNPKLCISENGTVKEDKNK